ncbi:electron transport complex subunit RsxC [Bovifimicola ammoniilytica]|uniref:electron transport complex subunit RsxC n=1 Tax=Bovifimicola ammoniilytica TaxID=2981720 RepID=UPI000820EDE7|nr:electron transport complex subunit RsxC [Bovifimicola ammoniilytica]MCU6753342.1 electron transport complex subunit RsxC [Bovifimicola ammoniilytica]SCJ60285.1 Nitrogen fixation protein rnfC [uncultured Eubacterium sp.]
MSLLTFKGGIHPYEGKELSKDKAIVEYFPKGDVAISMSQHIGAPAKPVVNVGDYVLTGQLIGEASGFISANVHSSVSGKVKAIEPRMLVNGSKATCIIIENDGKFDEVEFEKPKSLEELSKEEIVELVKKAGIVGMGGAGFPTNVKLSPKEPDKIDYVIVNGAECEPYLTSDYRRLIEEPEVVIVGLKVMLKLFDNAKGIIAVEDNKLDAIAKLKELVKSEDRIEIKTLYTKYPQGAERMLINAVTGRKINSSMLPADAGCVVDNVDTVFAIKSAVIDGRPLIKRVITVTGDAINEPHNFLVRTGTNHSELIDAAGGFKEEPEKIISGGPMMGMAISTIDVPVTKTSSALLCYVKDPLSKVKETNCINCGRCVSVCPGRIIPTRLAEFSERGDMENFVKYNGLECCECGCCSYICPAKRNLTQAIKSMRKQVLASKKK